MKRLTLALVAALTVVAVAVPAASARDYTVRAGGLVMDNPSGGVVQTLGQFKINLKAGPGHKVEYYNRTTGLTFRSQRLTKITFTSTSVKIVGWGLVNGTEKVRFTAIATDHPAQVDGFKIAWAHRAAHGGNVLTGNVHVRQISLS
jgi:hypothetical protein